MHAPLHPKLRRHAWASILLGLAVGGTASLLVARMGGPLYLGLISALLAALLVTLSYAYVQGRKRRRRTA